MASISPLDPGVQSNVCRTDTLVFLIWYSDRCAVGIMASGVLAGVKVCVVVVVVASMVSRNFLQT